MLLVSCRRFRNVQRIREHSRKRESQHSVTQSEHCGIKPIIRQAASPDLTCAAVWRSGDRDKFSLALFLEVRNQQRLPTANLSYNRYLENEEIRIQPMQKWLNTAITEKYCYLRNKSLYAETYLLLENMFAFAVGLFWKWCLVSLNPLQYPIVDLVWYDNK